MGMNQNNTYRFRKTSLFADIGSGNHSNNGIFDLEMPLPDSFISDNLRFSRISMYENKNNHSGDYNRKNAERSQGEFRSFQIGIDGKSQKIKLEPPVSKTRNRTTPDQLLALEHVCKTTMRPNKEMRIKLASKLNMNQRQVQIWFQNKRAKAKKLSKGAKVQESLEVQANAEVPRHRQETVVPQRFSHSGLHFLGEEFLRNDSSVLANASCPSFSAGNPYSMYSASSSYPRSYCNAGGFYPREREPGIYENDRSHIHHGKSYCTDTFSKLPSGNLRQYYQDESWDYLINESDSRVNNMYSSHPKGHYQNYNNNKQF